MKVLKLLPTLALAFLWQTTYANNVSISEDDSQDQKNQTDQAGKKQGHWVYYGKDKPKAGYSATDKIEEGPYKDNRKHGMWKFYYPANRLKSEIEYKYNRPNGKYTKYHNTTSGEPKVAEAGTWKGNKYVGSYIKKNEKGIVIQEKTFNSAGKTEGKVIYRADDGTPELEYESKNGVESGKLVRYYPNGDVMEEMVMNEGKVKPGTKVEKKRVNPPKKAKDTGGAVTQVVDPNKQNEGANKGKLHKVFTKIYNKNGDLEQDGYFENGRLMDGKWYKYDKNNLLYKIEIYKKGKYFGDGVLEF